MAAVLWALGSKYLMTIGTMPSLTAFIIHVKVIFSVYKIIINKQE